jgi:general secretion pathway protein F
VSSIFLYRAARLDGSTEEGSLEAASRDDASASLTRRGLFPLEVRFRAETTGRRPTMSSRDLSTGLKILSDLLESGLPVSRALRVFESLAPAGWRAALPHVRESVKEGRSLATALARAPVEIPALVLGLAQAGEAGAGIAPAIRRAAELTEATATMQAALRSALAYPLVVACAGVASIGVLVGVVLPRFAVVLADLGQVLPPSTRFVLAASAWARTASIPALLVAITVGIWWKLWTSTGPGRETWHALLLRMPLVGTVRHGAATARSAWSLAALLESGVPITTALPLAAKACGDAALEKRFAAASERIAGGERIAAAIDATGAMTSSAVRLARAGEESGRLASMLAHAAKLDNERADRMIQAGVRMMEPILLVGFAGIVAVVAAALLQAVYSVRPTQ